MVLTPSCAPCQVDGRGVVQPAQVQVDGAPVEASRISEARDLGRREIERSPPDASKSAIEEESKQLLARSNGDPATSESKKGWWGPSSALMIVVAYVLYSARKSVLNEVAEGSRKESNEGAGEAGRLDEPAPPVNLGPLITEAEPPAISKPASLVWRVFAGFSVLSHMWMVMNLLIIGIQSLVHEDRFKGGSMGFASLCLFPYVFYYTLSGWYSGIYFPLVATDSLSVVRTGLDLDRRPEKIYGMTMVNIIWIGNSLYTIATISLASEATEIIEISEMSLSGLLSVAQFVGTAFCCCVRFKTYVHSMALSVLVFGPFIGVLLVSLLLSERVGAYVWILPSTAMLVSLLLLYILVRKPLTLDGKLYGYDTRTPFLYFSYFYEHME